LQKIYQNIKKIYLKLHKKNGKRLVKKKLFNKKYETYAFSSEVKHNFSNFSPLFDLLSLFDNNLVSSCNVRIALCNSSMQLMSNSIEFLCQLRPPRGLLGLEWNIVLPATVQATNSSSQS
jgi:hypothetical protein